MIFKKLLCSKNFRVFSFLLFLYVVIVFLSLKYTTLSHGYNNYKSTLWADKSGYYMYLPATFIYGYTAAAWPSDITQRTGDGFIRNANDNKMITKYSIGPALLILPFFLLAHVLALIMGMGDGFGPVYQNMLCFAGAFYGVAGLFFLYRFLRFYVQPVYGLLTCFIVFTGTNLYYYTVSDPFMSHVYSFFLFSLVLYASERYRRSDFSFRWSALILAASLFIILIRPTDVLFVLFLPLLHSPVFSKSMDFVKSFLTLKKAAVAVILFLLLFGPQMLYWNFAFGSPLTYSYGDEGFTYLASPRIAEVLFSTNNGLFLYNPVYIVLLVSLIVSAVLAPRKWLPSVILTGIALYLMSSWYCWYYGCSFGLRPMVQYSAVLALPFAVFINKEKTHKIFRHGIIILCLLFAYVSINLVRVYDRCFYSGTWDFHTYMNYYSRSGMLHFPTRSYPWQDDYENDIIHYSSGGRGRLYCDFAHSGSCVTYSTADNPYTAGFDVVFENLIPSPPVKVDIAAYVTTEPADTSVFLVCDISRSDSSVFWFGYPVKESIKPRWEKAEVSLKLPPLQPTDRIRVYLWTPGGTIAYMDDFHVILHY